MEAQQNTLPKFSNPCKAKKHFILIKLGYESSWCKSTSSGGLFLTGLSIPGKSGKTAGVAQLVEYKLPKLGVASSNLVARSTLRGPGRITCRGPGWFWAPVGSGLRRGVGPDGRHRLRSVSPRRGRPYPAAGLRSSLVSPRPSLAPAAAPARGWCVERVRSADADRARG